MKRTITNIVAVLAAAALFVGLVHVVLVTTHISRPAATTVYGMTLRRLWATTAALMGLVGVFIGVRLIRRQSNGHARIHNRRVRAIVALVAGLFALINGVLNLALSKGGPGSGNGVIGGAAAIVLGLTATILGGIVFVRSRRMYKGSDNQN